MGGASWMFWALDAAEVLAGLQAFQPVKTAAGRPGPGPVGQRRKVGFCGLPRKWVPRRPHPRGQPRPSAPGPLPMAALRAQRPPSRVLAPLVPS